MRYVSCDTGPDSVCIFESGSHHRSLFAAGLEALWKLPPTHACQALSSAVSTTVRRFDASRGWKPGQLSPVIELDLWPLSLGRRLYPPRPRLPRRFRSMRRKPPSLVHRARPLQRPARVQDHRTTTDVQFSRSRASQVGTASVTVLDAVVAFGARTPEWPRSHQTILPIRHAVITNRHTTRPARGSLFRQQ